MEIYGQISNIFQELGKLEIYGIIFWAIKGHQTQINNYHGKMMYFKTCFQNVLMHYQLENLDVLVNYLLTFVRIFPLVSENCSCLQLKRPHLKIYYIYSEKILNRIWKLKQIIQKTLIKNKTKKTRILSNLKSVPFS